MGPFMPQKSLLIAKPRTFTLLESQCVSTPKSVLVPHRKIRYKLNSDEKEQIAKAEREKRRKIRLIQVREISKKNAATIRNAVRLEKLKQLQKLADNISDEFDKSKTQQLKELEANYENSLRNIGRAHTNALQQMEDENIKQRFKKENKLKATYRHNAALERLRDDQVRKYVHDNKHIIARKAVLEKEKERAAQIASLPKPSPGILQDVQQNVYPVSIRNENQDDIYYPVTTMVKRHHNDSVEDGRQAAIIQEKRLDEQLNRTRSLVVEREQVAKIRFKKALDKELLNRDSEKVIKELSFLQKKQMKRRQKQLATIPKQVFLPPYKRAEALQDKQRVMEEEFEQFYVGDQMALKSDLSVLLEPHPPLESPCQTDALDLTLTSDIEASPAKNLPSNQSSIMKDITNVSLPSAQTTTTKRQTLKSLFNRIKSQRDDWISDMAEHLHDAEVPAQRNQTPDPGTPSPLPTTTESGENYETEISDSLTEVFGALEETGESSQGIPLNEMNSGTIPVAHVVQKMEEIQRQLQQLDLTGEDNQQEVLTRPEESKDVASGDDADFQPAAIASHLKKQIAEVLEQKKRIQEQRNQLEERLRQFDQHQNNTSLGGYALNPPSGDPSQFTRPSGDPSRGLIRSPADDGSTEHSKDGAKDVLDTKILNSGSNVASLSNSDAEMDPCHRTLDQQSPNYLTNEALKHLPKDIAKVQQYQQKIIQQHTDRIKRIEEIQMDIKQHRQTLKDSISGIQLAETISKPDPTTSTMITADPTTSTMITADPPTFDPLESTTKPTNGTSSISGIPASSQTSVSMPFLPRVDHKSLPNWNRSKDQILGSDLYRSDGSSLNGMDFLPTYQSCIQESIAGNLFGSDFHSAVFSTDVQESNTGKEKYPAAPLGGSTQYPHPGDLSVEMRPSEPNTPDLGITSKIYDPCAFTPSFDLESFPTEPIPSSELQEIRKSLPFDETLEDSAQPTPVPSVTASPFKKSYIDGAISESKESDIPDLTDSLISDFTENEGDFLQIKKQLEEVRKQKEKLCQRLMDNQYEQRAMESVEQQEGLPSGLDDSDHTPFVTELSNAPKKHPPLLPRAYLYGHSPHELSAIQEKDSSVLSSHLSDMHSKLSMSSSICSTSEPTQPNLDNLISGQLLEEKKLWNILKILKHENRDSSQIENKTDNSFATSSPLLSEFDTSIQPPPDTTLSRGSPSDQPSISEVSKPSTSTKTWAQILLERSQLTAETDTETSTSVLQEAPNSACNSEKSFPISTDTDSTVLRNFCFDATGAQLIDPKTLSQDDRKTILALSSSLRSLHCEPKSSETSSDESKMILCGHPRDCNSPSTQIHDSSEGSSLTNSDFPSMSSFTKELLQNHQELSEFLSRILQTSKTFHSEILQQSPRALPLDATDQNRQNSTGMSSPHVSSTVSLSPPRQNQRDSNLALHPSTVSDTIASANAELTSSALFQLTSTTNQSVMGQGPTLCAWSPSTVDNIANQSVTEHGSALGVWSPVTVDNIANMTSTSPADADSKTNSSDASLISVIPQTLGGQVTVSSSTVDVDKILKQSSPSLITASSPLPSQPNYQSNASSSVIKTDNLKSATTLSSHPSNKEVLSSYKAAVSQEQTKDEIMNMRPTSQAYSIPSSTPNSLLKSHPYSLAQLSDLSDLSHSPYIFPVDQDTANHSISASLISPNLPRKSTSLSALTQFSITTTPESSDNVDVSPPPDIQGYLIQQARNISTSSPGHSLSSYYSVPISEGTAPPFTMEATAGVELSKISESLLPSVTTVIAALSSSSVSSRPSTQLQYQPTDEIQTRTKESPSCLSTPSPILSSCQMQCTIQTQKILSNQTSSASLPDNKDASQLYQSKVSESLSQIELAPVNDDQSEGNKSSPASLENLSLTQYSYTSPETGSDKSLPPSSQIDHFTSTVSSNHQLLQKHAANVPEQKPSDSIVQGIDPWKNPEPFGTNSDLWISMAQDVSMNQSSSESGSFKCTKSLSESCSSHLEKQSSPEVQLQIKEQSSTDSSSKDESPCFVPLMYNRNTTSSDSTDTTPEKILPAQKSFQTTLDLDGSVAEVSSLMAKVSSPPELTDSHHSSKMVSSPELSGLSGLSQLSLPSDMMEDYQHLIQQARTLVKRCKANLQQEDGDKIFASRDSGLLSGTTVASTQALFSEADQLVEKRSLLPSEDKRRKDATNRGINEMRGEHHFSLEQISDLDHELGISDEPNLSLVFSSNDSPTVGKEGQADNIQWLNTGSSNLNYAGSGDYFTDNKVAVSVNPQRLDTATTSQSKMMSEQRITNSVAAWKLKYSLANQTKE